MGIFVWNGYLCFKKKNCFWHFPKHHEFVIADNIIPYQQSKEKGTLKWCVYKKWEKKNSGNLESQTLHASASWDMSKLVHFIVYVAFFIGRG